MRWLLVVVVVVVGCKREVNKEGAAPPATPPAVGDAGAGSAGSAAVAAPADAAAPIPGDIDLLHAIPTTLAVSSVVANPKHSPFDLFDGDPTTAWNGKTGQLVGAWIAVRVPASTHVKAFRLTAGYAATGPEGDYFVMNPRIKRVAVWHDGIKLREHDLDITKRELQDVPVDATGGDYKLEVIAVEPGTKKNWREACVSDLQVIGRPPPGMKLGLEEPEVSIGSLDGKRLTPTGLTLDPLDPKDALPAALNDKGPPIPALPAGWTGQWLEGPADKNSCLLALTAKGKHYILEDVGCEKEPIAIGHGHPYVKSRFEVRVAELLGDGGEPELLVVMPVEQKREKPEFGGNADVGQLWHERLAVCAAGEGGVPHCASGLIGIIEEKFESADDGLDQWIEQLWRRDYAIDRGVLVIRAGQGKPDEYEDALAIGRHALRVAL